MGHVVLGFGRFSEETASERNDARGAMPRHAAVPFWITCIHSAISSCDSACSSTAPCGEMISKQKGTVSCRASRTVTVARGSEVLCSSLNGSGGGCASGRWYRVDTSLGMHVPGGLPATPPPAPPPVPVAVGVGSGLELLAGAAVGGQ